MTDEEMIAERTACLEAVLYSKAPQKVIVAGPGAGKSYTFRKVLDNVSGEALILSFLGNLVADLERSLGGPNRTVRTFHSFSRGLLHHIDVPGITRGVDYFPGFGKLLEIDAHLVRDGVPDFAIEQALMYHDESAGLPTLALQVGDYYNAVGHTDAVYRVHRALSAKPALVPAFEYVLVDEYQDFSLLEVSLIDLLGARNQILIVGDDDQALYGFKHASADYLRDLVNLGQYQRFELPFCTRCTEVLVDATHRVIKIAQQQGLLRGRLDKRYICFLPDKRAASQRYPKIRHAHCTVERNNAPYICRFIAQQIAAIDASDIATSHNDGNPTALVIAPQPFAGRIHEHLVAEGVKNLEYKTRPRAELEILDGYRRLLADERSRLGWRLVVQATQPAGWEAAVRKALLDDVDLVDLLPIDFRTLHLGIVATLRRLINEQLQDGDDIELERATGLPMADLRLRLTLDPPDPPTPLDTSAPRVVITTLQGAKGLQAEHVFVAGLNEQHFPRSNQQPTDDEVCQLLVALTRARQRCTLISCGRLGNASLKASVFLTWLAPSLQRIDINAAHW